MNSHGKLSSLFHLHKRTSTLSIHSGNLIWKEEFIVVLVLKSSSGKPHRSSCLITRIATNLDLNSFGWLSCINAHVAILLCLSFFQFKNSEIIFISLKSLLYLVLFRVADFSHFASCPISSIDCRPELEVSIFLMGFFAI